LLRAIRTALKAGLEVISFEVTKGGSIIVHTGTPEETDSNPWDKLVR
jgi:hypothetical protein